MFVICWIELVWATDSHLNLYKHVRSVLLSVMLLTLKIVETPFKDFMLFAPCTVVQLYDVNQQNTPFLN